MLTRWRVQVVCICVWSGWRQAADTSHLYSDTRTLDTRRQQHRLKIYPLQYFTISVSHSNNAQCRLILLLPSAAPDRGQPEQLGHGADRGQQRDAGVRGLGLAGAGGGVAQGGRQGDHHRQEHHRSVGCGGSSEVVISTFRFTHWLLRYGWWIVVRQQRILGEVIGVNVYRW